ncbi:MAG: hypothetical protein JWO03_2219 [Bacteroidetes bacterium]|nr:hypothetical protein [Bacteroidota bacterium]
MTPNTHTRNFFNSIGDPADVKGNGTEHLKLSVDHRHIRYFIEAGDTHVYYGEYALQSVATDADLREQVEIILSKDPFLHKSYALVKILWQNDFEIVPTAFYDEDERTAGTGVNTILGGDAKFLFEKISGADQLLEEKFPLAVHYHSGAVLIETLGALGLTQSKDLFINIHAQNIEVLYFDETGALKIYNRYEYRSYQDYIYFVLLVADEMNLNREETKAVLMGEVSADSQLYEVTTRYFRQTAFIKQPADKRFSSTFEGYPVHFNYPLYNL